jgi:hypothetical protein
VTHIRAEQDAMPDVDPIPRTTPGDAVPEHLRCGEGHDFYCDIIGHRANELPLVDVAPQRIATPDNSVVSLAANPLQEALHRR